MVQKNACLKQNNFQLETKKDNQHAGNTDAKNAFLVVGNNTVAEAEDDRYMNLTTKNHWGDDTTLAAEEVAAGDGLDTTAAVVGDHKDHVTKTVKKKNIYYFAGS